RDRNWTLVLGPTDAVALGPERGLRAVADADPLEDVREVGLDGLLADLQAARDQLVRQARADQAQHLELAVGEATGALGGARGQHLGGDLRRKRRLAARRGPDAAIELLGLG